MIALVSEGLLLCGRAETTSPPRVVQGGAPSSAVMTRNSPAAGSETDRTIGELTREGVIESVDLDAGVAVVRIGDQLTPPIDWTMWTGDTTIWLPPTVGQQVIVDCPEGDLERGFIRGGLRSSSMAPLFLGSKVAIRFKDGALIHYDPDAQVLTFALPGSATITAPDGVSIMGDVSIDGDVGCTGTITAQEDVVGGGKSLKGHKHLGVTTGSGVSGLPQ